MTDSTAPPSDVVDSDRLPEVDAASDEVAAQRAAKVAALRKSWLDGSLDLSIPVDGSGFDRLLREILDDGSEEGPPPPRPVRRR